MQWQIFVRVLFLFPWLGIGFLFADNVRTFKNPVVAAGADPWVIRWQNNYYLCQSHPDGIWINRAERLEDIGADHWKCVWRPPENTPYSKQLWAPELHFLQGKWYIYFAADDGDNFNHCMYVLEGGAQDPQAPFVFKGKIAAPSDRWAIDGTVLEMPDQKLYFIWSGWEGTSNVAQNLYIAPMSNPWTIDGRRVCISRPDHTWEKRDLRSSMKVPRRSGTMDTCSSFIRPAVFGMTIIVWGN